MYMLVEDWDHDEIPIGLIWVQCYQIINESIKINQIIILRHLSK